jgi:hypothetical protein
LAVPGNGVVGKIKRFAAKAPPTGNVVPTNGAFHKQKHRHKAGVFV